MMLEWLRSKFAKPRGSGVVLPRIDRQTIRFAVSSRFDLPQMDWGAADVWLEREYPGEIERQAMRRAVAHAWLEELRDALKIDHQCWRTASAEGLTPLGDALGQRLATSVDRYVAELARVLRRVRGEGPVPPIAIVGLRPTDAYISFEASFSPEEGQSATSGGFYAHREMVGFPIIAMNLTTSHSAECTLAHELTHHALVECNLPQWAEEGITQMMEERLVGVSDFGLLPERVREQRERWAGSRIEDFLSGNGFRSAEGNDQELAYHLSQWVVRAAIERDAGAFFAFLKDCQSMSETEACDRHLGCTPAQFVQRTCGIEADDED